MIVGHKRHLFIDVSYLADALKRDVLEVLVELLLDFRDLVDVLERNLVVDLVPRELRELVLADHPLHEPGGLRWLDVVLVAPVLEHAHDHAHRSLRAHVRRIRVEVLAEVHHVDAERTERLTYRILEESR